jgi:predicted ribosome quality control (RQC) complex YloA/Tae2 family protein
VVTDWVLVRRLAFELEERLRGARLVEAGFLDDGCLALALRRRRSRAVLAIDLFGSPPLVTIESGDRGLRSEPGFVRAVADALGGMTLAKVSARRGDRLMRFEFRARSRFGVGAALDLYIELVPRFGNAVLVKGETIVAAAKAFSPAENRMRAVMPGLPYVLAPLPNRASLAAAALADSEAAMREPLFVYRHDGAVLQVSLVALPALPQAQVSREPSLIEIFAELRVQRAAEKASQMAQRRRRELLGQLDRRERKLRGELHQLERKRARASGREELRREGEAIFTSLHERPEHERSEAKERATALFAEYKKLGAALPHLVARERHVRESIDAIESLQWEAERTGDDEIGDVEHAVAQLARHARSQPRASAHRHRRAPLELRTVAGSRILIGRTPSENAELSFRIARPDDLWFHARGVPGAHVVLARDDRISPPPQDVQAAAALAAFHSKARSAGAVAVDYTLRKFVRKRPDAPPGLVWYTHPTTVLAKPSDAPAGVISDPALP